MPRQDEYARLQSDLATCREHLKMARADASRTRKALLLVHGLPGPGGPSRPPRGSSLQTGAAWGRPSALFPGDGAAAAAAVHGHGDDDSYLPQVASTAAAAAAQAAQDRELERAAREAAEAKLREAKAALERKAQLVRFGAGLWGRVGRRASGSLGTRTAAGAWKGTKQKAPTWETLLRSKR